MADSSFTPWVSFLFFIFLTSDHHFHVAEASHAERKVYIVSMVEKPSTPRIPPQELHLNVLSQVLQDSLPSKSLIYSYRKSYSGFAAKLTEQEKQKLEGINGVLDIIPSKIYELHTSRSWDFLGFPTTVTRSLKIESDIIVGMIDSGIWPDSDSFSDEGFGPVPKRWKGTCEKITCNKKVIGARYYNSQGDPSEDSPLDMRGHGSHTASTVAGNSVTNASLYGIGAGTVRGAVPGARLAIYKVCGASGCATEDILAGFDDAIADGVDVISLSVGGPVTDYKKDTIAVGSFRAMMHGILTSASAGNQGPYWFSASNIAPWIMTVAASGTDRMITSEVVLGDGTTLQGTSINTFPTMEKPLPLIYGKDAGNSFSKYTYNAELCEEGSLDPKKAQGKIIICRKFNYGASAIDVGAAGIIIIDDGNTHFDVARAIALPSSVFNSTNGGDKLENYMKNSRNPVARILHGRTLLDPKSDIQVSTFSSRGPNTISPNILKPDLTAPGINILASWSAKASISTGVKQDKRSTLYNIISGTSMSCPHATGAAAYVKSFHPDWSPSAIKSALMTTASPLSETANPDAEFGSGSGQIDPVKAVTPGLVYDSDKKDYVQFLCNSGYSERDISAITGESETCGTKGDIRDLNYPSIAYKHGSDSEDVYQFNRTVTNVGFANSTYKATVKSPSSVAITVEPTVLSFTKLLEKKSFTIKISAKPLSSSGDIRSSSLVWSDGVHSVRIPIVVFYGVPL